MGYRLYFTIKGQRITLSQKLVASDSVNYIGARYDFTADWNGLTKIAKFRKGDTNYDVLLEDDKIEPSKGLNLSEGQWVCSVVGLVLDGENLVERITTVPCRLIVEKSDVSDGEPFPEITASVGEQFVAKAAEEALKAKTQADKSTEEANKSKSSADEAKDALDELKRGIESGDFKGDPGEPGEPGKDGYTPIKGVDYFDGEPGQPGEPGKEIYIENPYDDTELRKEIISQNEEIAKKIDKPTEAPQVGKVLKIKSVNEDGTFVCEWADAGAGNVEDVTVNGDSIVVDGVAEIPIASNDKYGLIKGNGNGSTGIIVGGYGAGIPYIVMASNAAIDARSNMFMPIVPKNLEYAVHSIIPYSFSALSQEDYDLIEIKDESTLYFITE